MNIINKLQPLFIILSAIMGIFTGYIIQITTWWPFIINFSLTVLLFFVFSGVKIKEITQSFINYKFSITSLVINFLWTPVFAALLGTFLLRGEIDLQMGFLMLAVTPCTDWYLIFTGISRGNVALGSSILPLNLLLQVLLLPVYLLIFYGNSLKINGLEIAFDILHVLIIPFIFANIIPYVLKKINKLQNYLIFIKRYSDNLQLLFLCIAVFSMFSFQGKLLINNPIVFIKITAPLLVFFIFTFYLANITGNKLKMSFPDKIALLFTVSARNSPISLTIASVTFPERPLISLALIVAPLLELPILTLYSGILKKMENKSLLKEN